ncbi:MULTISPECIES: MetQ/NlpA family ABC transporter substrate-binding protein [Rhodococcus]|uniref:Lipoprotein n=2 Tax=Rhodococcus pyridinivorans TaxID=103816 RepID=V9XDP3_9NOCA|nr:MULTISPECIES: MetQ/NlpA family ABC transporter substrate-binding protein [Rhodococcus]AHD20115.1 ABC transporter substrate-binding protein [Rhodococcus pyridinivorans SB3094]AWZ25457.1 ABC transporter substrate-binding protein [Rhodococcus pyridinivorans]MBX4168305.1 ABC transporter substrate-binding protein [Rhodococcus sp. DMU2021]MCD2117442.1 MetQ/NlpA family ABC transporter substrate-binding protein [Rhodococcus pyridinivorans]MCD2139112.1 MetQ/NlpA family ABC transporter substrate-bind
MSLRRIVVASAALTLAAGLAACSSSEGDDTTLRISASSTPHVEILDQIVSTGALGDYKLDIVEITGEVDPNELLEAGDVDANFFQHEPYLTDWQKQKGIDDLVAVADVHLEPIGLYSNKIASLDELKDGDTVAVPRDTTNYARALYLLESAGLLEMDVPFEEADLSVVTESNITANPKNLNLVSIERPQLARQLDDAQITAAVINSNYALEAGLNPAEDAIVTEEVENNPFSNLLVVRAENENDPAVTALAEALESPETAAWIEETYSGAVLPVHSTN